jgi:pSer/pThr/pTyr-binding forkhead associated (FHA) protein
MADEEGGYPCLEVLSGPRGRGRYRLQKGNNAIGRSRENDIVLDDSSVSRRHAVVEVAENGATVADLGSRNGTKRWAVRKSRRPCPSPTRRGSKSVSFS